MLAGLKRKYLERKPEEHHAYRSRTGNSHGPTPKDGAKKGAAKRQGMGRRKRAYGPF